MAPDDPAPLYDLTCRVSGHECDMLVTVGPLERRPDNDEERQFKANCVEQYGKFFVDDPWQTAAVTVGLHRPEGDDDPEVG